MADIEAKDKLDHLHPFDCSTLKKGDNLLPEFCESVTRCKRSDKGYSFALLKLKATIESTRANMGTPLVLTIRKDGIRVLTDEEAAVYTRGRFKQGEKQLIVSHGRGMTVDLGNVPSDSAKEHVRGLELQSKKLQAIIRTEEEFTLAPHKRQVPTLEPEGKKDATEEK
jgi:hypothetical protein